MALKKKIKPEEDSVLISEFLCQGEIKNEKIQFTKVFFKKYCECTKIYDVWKKYILKRKNEFLFYE